MLLNFSISESTEKPWKRGVLYFEWLHLSHKLTESKVAVSIFHLKIANAVSFFKTHTGYTLARTPTEAHCNLNNGSYSNCPSGARAQYHLSFIDDSCFDWWLHSERDTLVKDAIIAGFVINGHDRTGIKACLPLQCSMWCHLARLRARITAELTRVCHELKWAAEFPVAGSCASTHMEHIGSKGGQTLDVSVPGRSFYDSVASFILVLTTNVWEQETN